MRVSRLEKHRKNCQQTGTGARKREWGTMMEMPGENGSNISMVIFSLFLFHFPTILMNCHSVAAVTIMAAKLGQTHRCPDARDSVKTHQHGRCNQCRATTLSIWRLPKAGPPPWESRATLGCEIRRRRIVLSRNWQHKLWTGTKCTVEDAILWNKMTQYWSINLKTCD